MFGSLQMPGDATQRGPGFAPSRSLGKPGPLAPNNHAARRESRPRLLVRRIGLAASVAQAERIGWSDPARASLEACRADVAPVVPESAELVFPPGGAASMEGPAGKQALARPPVT
jgi:hypothetical protein